LFFKKQKADFLFTAKIFFSIFIINMNKIDNVNFGATPISKVKIKKYDTSKKKFVTAKAVFVRLDGRNDNDLKAIDYINKNWEKTPYTKTICTAANWMKNNELIKIYALTEQSKNYTKLRPTKILGLADMREEQEDGNVLEHLQVKPSAININSNNRKYKKVGSSILKSLKKVYNQIALVSVNNPNIEKFYKDNGFIEFADAKGNYIWYKNIILRLKLKFQNFRNRTGIF
jgi:hypothetical protein